MVRNRTAKAALVIDDDPMSCDLLCLLLEEEGYEVKSADSGETALRVLDGSWSPDLVLADVQLPGTSGAPLARSLRKVCGDHGILLAMSGSQPAAEAVSLYDGFLLKPFRMDDVAKHMQARKKAGATSTPARRRSGDAERALNGAPRTQRASKSIMKVQSEELLQASPADTETSASQDPVLNETIYEQLAVALPSRQLQEMYAMCVSDARRRILGMRRLAEDRDTAKFMREAHALKGGCGMLGATELHRMAAKLEVGGPDALSSGPAQEVNSLDELSAACDRLERMLGSRR